MCLRPWVVKQKQKKSPGDGAGVDAATAADGGVDADGVDAAADGGMGIRPVAEIMS